MTVAELKQTLNRLDDDSEVWIQIEPDINARLAIDYYIMGNDVILTNFMSDELL